MCRVGRRGSVVEVRRSHVEEEEEDREMWRKGERRERDGEGRG